MEASDYGSFLDLGILCAKMLSEKSFENYNKYALSVFNEFENMGEEVEC